MRAPLLLLLSLLPLATTGCSSRDCTLASCIDGADIVLTGLADKFAANLPVTLKACVGSACSSFRLDHTGAAPVCTAVTAGTALCSIDGFGTVVLSDLPLPPSTAAGATLAVHATVTDANGVSLYDSTQMVTITSSQPNGAGCEPTCTGASVAFAP